MTHDPTHLRELPFRRLDGDPANLKTAALVMVALGAIALVAALFTGAERAWQAYLFNWLFFFSLAQGAVVLVAATAITKAVWARPLRRIALSFAAFLPIGLLLYLPLAFAGEQIFPWTHQMYHEGLEVWLNEPFVAVRNIVALAALVFVSLLFLHHELRPDAGLVLDEVDERQRGWYRRLTRDWRGQEEEERRAYRRLGVLAPVLALVWAASLSVVAWDYVMALEAGWFSTLIGPYFFMGGFLGGLAATAILAVFYRSRLDLKGVIEPPHFHDLGKLTFAFCIFWAYLFWSQYIVIWYGQLPYEQTFLVHRLSPPFGWLSVLVFGFLFLAPFISLLSVRAKKNPAWLAGTAALILLGLWLERYILVYPSLYPGADGMPFGWQEIGLALFFGGILLGSLLWFAATFPILQMWQPMVSPEIFEDDREARDYMSTHGAPDTES